LVACSAICLFSIRFSHVGLFFNAAKRRVSGLNGAAPRCVSGPGPDFLSAPRSSETLHKDSQHGLWFMVYD
jgi:hypothetical protein